MVIRVGEWAHAYGLVLAEGRKQGNMNVSEEQETLPMQRKKRFAVRSLISVLALALVLGAAGVGLKSTFSAPKSAHADADATVKLDRLYCSLWDAHYATINDGITAGCYSYEWTLGYLYPSQRDNTQALFDCAISETYTGEYGPYGIEKNFLSTNPDCDGNHREATYRLGPVGWISTVQVANSTPLYRCSRPVALYGLDHFFTSDEGCESGNGTLDGLMGYTLNSNT